MSEIEVFRDEKSYRLIGSSRRRPKHQRSAGQLKPSPWLQYGAASLPAPPRLTSSKRRSPPSPLASKAATTFSSLLTRSISRIGPWQKSVKFSPAPASLSHDVQASQISSPSTTLSSPGNFKFLPSTRISDHSEQEPQITLLRPGPTFTPSRTGPQRQALGQLRPRPGYRKPSAPTFLELPSRRQLATQPAKSQPSPPQAASQNTQPPSAAYSYTQPRTTNPLPTQGPQLRHSRPALLHQRKPRRPFTPPHPPLPYPRPPAPPTLRPPSSSRLKLTPIIDPNTSHSPLFPAVSSSPEPPFLFLPPRLYPYLQTH